MVNSGTLDQIIEVLKQQQDITPWRLLEICHQQYSMTTLDFTKALARLEQVGLVRRVSVINSDSSESTVYCLN